MGKKKNKGEQRDKKQEDWLKFFPIFQKEKSESEQYSRSDRNCQKIRGSKKSLQPSIIREEMPCEIEGRNESDEARRKEPKEKRGCRIRSLSRQKQHSCQHGKNKPRLQYAKPCRRKRIR